MVSHSERYLQQLCGYGNFTGGKNEKSHCMSGLFPVLGWGALASFPWLEMGSCMLSRVVGESHTGPSDYILLGLLSEAVTNKGFVMRPYKTSG